MAKLPQKYYEAEKEYSMVRGVSEKIRVLEKMLICIPRIDENNKVRTYVTHRLAQLRKELRVKAEIKRKIKAGKGLLINKDLPLIGVVGYANAGKTALINRLCGTDYKSTSTPFETKQPIIGVMSYEDVKIQLLEIPSTLELQHLSLLKQADLILLMGDETLDLKELLVKQGINVKTFNPASGVTPEELWLKTGLIRVYSKQDPKNPFVLKQASTIKDFVLKIHKGLLEKFKAAQVWGVSARFPGQTASLTHKLEDKDVVNIRFNK